MTNLFVKQKSYASKELMWMPSSSMFAIKSTWELIKSIKLSWVGIDRGYISTDFWRYLRQLSLIPVMETQQKLINGQHLRIVKDRLINGPWSLLDARHFHSEYGTRKWLVRSTTWIFRLINLSKKIRSRKSGCRSEAPWQIGNQQLGHLPIVWPKDPPWSSKKNRALWWNLLKFKNSA